MYHAEGVRAYLIEKDVLPVASLGCELLQVPILADAMLLAELLPELAAH